MAIADTMRLAWRQMPDRVGITLRVETSAGVYTDVPVSNCFRRPAPGLLEAEFSAAAYVRRMETWYIPKAMYPAEPKPRWIVRLATVTNTASPHYGLGGDYYILPEGVSEAGALGCWKCSTGLWFIQPALAQVVNIYRPTTGVGDGGRPVNTSTTTIGTNISVYIQGNEGDDAIDAYGKMQLLNHAVCYLPSALVVQPHDFLIDAGGLKWSIVGDLFTNMLGALMAVKIERAK